MMMEAGIYIYAFIAVHINSHCLYLSKIFATGRVLSEDLSSVRMKLDGTLAAATSFGIDSILLPHCVENPKWAKVFNHCIAIKT